METMRQVAEEQCDIRERSPESVRDDERQTAGASTQQCCNAWIALRRIWLSLRHGCMAEKHSSNLCKNSCDGG